MFASFLFKLRLKIEIAIYVTALFVDIFTFEQFSLPLCAYTRRTHHAGIEQLHWHPLQAGDLGVPSTIGPGAGLPCRRLSARGRLWTANPEVS